MLRLGNKAWELINIPKLEQRVNFIFSQIDPENICILGGFCTIEPTMLKNGVILNTITRKVTKINPTSKIAF